MSPLLSRNSGGRMILPRCTDCGEILDCRTDSIGRMHYLHRQPCVSRVDVRYKTNCSACGRMIEVEKRPRSDFEYGCSERCIGALRIAREAKKRADVVARWAAA